MMSHPRIVRLMMLALSLSGGCAKKSRSLTQADVEAVNALVPAAVRNRVEFEITQIKDEIGQQLGHANTPFKVIVPKGSQGGL